MKIRVILFALLVLVGCKRFDKKAVLDEEGFTFYVGTYTDSLSKGIYKYKINTDGTMQLLALAAEANNPSYLALSANKQFLVANTELNSQTDKGTIESFLISEDSLIFISKSSSGGVHPCFVGVNEQGYVLAANYRSGSTGLLKYNTRGILSEVLDVRQHEGNGLTERQEGPHAHSAWFDPINNNVISVDLGTNELWFYRLDTILQKLQPLNPPKLAMAEGAGPRHLAFHPNNKWFYVINELNSTVTQVNRSNSNVFHIGATASTLPTDFTGENFCADIHVSSDGKFVYASNRGLNSIAIFRVTPQYGTLTLLGNEPTRGSWPRNFSLSPDNKLLLVANQYSNNMVSFKRDKETGLLEYLAEIEAPSPVCILFN